MASEISKAGDLISFGRCDKIKNLDFQDEKHPLFLKSDRAGREGAKPPQAPPLAFPLRGGGEKAAIGGAGGGRARRDGQVHGGSDGVGGC